MRWRAASARSVRRVPWRGQYDCRQIGRSRGDLGARRLTEHPVLSAIALADSVDGQRVVLAAAGAWTAERAAELERVVERAAARYGGPQTVDIDLAKLERLDTFGAWLIERLQRALTGHGAAARIVNLSDANRALIDEVCRVNRSATPARPSPGRIVTVLDAVGRAVAEIGRSVVLQAHLLGALTIVALGAVARPARLHIASVVHHLERVGW